MNMAQGKGKRKKSRSNDCGILNHGQSDTEDEEDQYTAPSMYNVTSSQSNFKRSLNIEISPDYLPLLFTVEHLCNKGNRRTASFDDVDNYLKKRFSSIFVKFVTTKEYCESARTAGMPVNFSFNHYRQSIETIWTSMWEQVKDYDKLDGPESDGGSHESRQIYLSNVDVTLEVVKAVLHVSSAPGQAIRTDLVVRLLHKINCDMEFFGKLVHRMQKMGYLLHFDSAGQDECIKIGPIENAGQERKLLEDTIMAFFVKQVKKSPMGFMSDFERFVDKVEPNLYLVAHTYDCAQIIRNARQLEIPVEIVNDGKRLIFTGLVTALHEFEEDPLNKRRYGF